MSERTARGQRQQPYGRKIEAAIRDGAIPRHSGMVGRIDVAHDDWCPKLRGGPCNCDPDLSIRWEPAPVGGKN